MKLKWIQQILGFFVVLAIISTTSVADKTGYFIPRVQKIMLNTTITLNTDALFEFNEAELKGEGKRCLNQFISNIKANKLNVASFDITGYTDRIGSYNKNLNLSQRRADSVAAYLKSQGVQSIFKVRGRGEAKPVARGCSDKMKRSALIACLAPDRRVEIILQGKQNKIRGFRYGTN
jgi:OOP family OmpA-OmpF porin